MTANYPIASVSVDHVLENARIQLPMLRVRLNSVDDSLKLWFAVFQQEGGKGLLTHVVAKVAKRLFFRLHVNDA